MRLTYNISGDYITNLARSWFYDERRPYNKVEELLLGCMGGTTIPQQTLKQYAFQLIVFEKRFIGYSGDDTFYLVPETTERKEELRKQFPLYKYAKDMIDSGKVPFEVCEYGFIDPQGKYIPVGWGEHSNYANTYVRESGLWKERMQGEYMDNNDFLVYGKNWILIDNPYRGIGYAHLPLRINKKQRETLYDYYIFHNRIKEAMKLYEEVSEC